MLEAPPSRYKIIERDRRLITIDMQTGEPVGSAPGATAGVSLEAPASPAMRSTNSNMGGPARGETILGAGRSGSQSAQATSVGSPRGPLATLAGFFPRAKLGGDGRVTLTTAPYYDAEAPRQMRLTQGKTDALGAYVIALGITTVLGFILVVQTSMIIGTVILVFITIKVGDPINKNVLRHLISDAELVG